MKNKLLVPFIIAIVVGVAGTGSMTTLFLLKNNEFNDLQQEYTILDSEHQELNDDYDDLNATYNSLVLAFEELFNTTEDLEDEIEGIMTMVKLLPLIDKMSFYYQFARFACFDHSTSQAAAQTGAEMILHGSKQYNAFSTLDTILNAYDFFEKGSSMNDAWEAVVNTFNISQDEFSPAWLDCWAGTNTEVAIFNWVKNNIYYTLDDLYCYDRTYPFDLYLSALEMLKYKRGDCDDFSILTATMMENNGFDTAFGVVHDNSHPDFPSGGLHHAFIFVQIDPLDYPTSNLWSFDGGITYDWLLVDSTPGWTANIGDNPSWLQHYFDTAFSDWNSIFTWAFADAP